jgi:hypothetical protein
MQVARSLSIGLAAVLVAAAIFLHALTTYVRAVGTPASPMVVVVPASPSASPALVSSTPDAVAALPSPSPTALVASVKASMGTPSPVPSAASPAVSAMPSSTPSTVAVAPPEPAEQMTLEGTIISTPGNSLAFVQTHDGSHLTLREGQMVEGFRVARIGDSEIELTQGSHKRTLKMEAAHPPPPTPATGSEPAGGGPTPGLLPPPPQPQPAASPVGVMVAPPPPVVVNVSPVVYEAPAPAAPVTYIVSQPSTDFADYGYAYAGYGGYWPTSYGGLHSHDRHGGYANCSPPVLGSQSYGVGFYHVGLGSTSGYGGHGSGGFTHSSFGHAGGHVRG